MLEKDVKGEPDVILSPLTSDELPVGDEVALEELAA